MKPAYRPGLVPRVALKPRMGGRSRGDLLNDLMSECPSLLNDLIFYPMWIGSQCIDMISGKPLTNSANLVTPSMRLGAETSGYYDATLTQSLSFDSSVLQAGDIDFSIGCWVQPTNLSAITSILRKYTTTGNKREYGLYWDSSTTRFIFVVSNDGTASTSVSAKAACPMDRQYFVASRHSAPQNQLLISVNNENALPVSYSSGIYASDSVFYIGSLMGATQLFSGWIGACPIWKRSISDREIEIFYNNGQGITYPG